MTRVEELSGYIEQLVYYMKVNEQANPCGAASLQEIQVVSFIDRRREVKMRDISDYLMLGLSNLTAITDKLIAKKMIVRRRSEEDRRVVWVSLTDAGQTVARENHKQKLHLAKKMLATLDSGKQAQLISLMKSITQKMA